MIRKPRNIIFTGFMIFSLTLTWENPEVRAEIRRIVGYWIELGIAGFRVDAVPFIIAIEDPEKKKDEMKFEYLSEIYRFLQWRRGDSMLLGEAYVMPEENKKYFGDNGSGIHLTFM